MRSDFDKVVIERPRYGHSDKYHNYRAANNRGEFEDLPAKQGMRRPHHTKSFSDLLGPLKRYLRRQVGRPWDCVYSEISQNFNSGSTIHQHIRDHVFDFVTVQVTREDDELIGCSRRGYRFGRVSGLYVDPDNGLLCWREPFRRRYVHKTDPDRCDIDGERYVRVNGCWFVGLYRDLPRDETRVDRHGSSYVVPGSGYDVVLGYSVDRADPGRPTRYAHARRQLNTRELLRLGLENQYQ